MTLFLLPTLLSIWFAWLLPVPGRKRLGFGKSLVRHGTKWYHICTGTPPADVESALGAAAVAHAMGLHYLSAAAWPIPLLTWASCPMWGAPQGTPNLVSPPNQHSFPFICLFDFLFFGL